MKNSRFKKTSAGAAILTLSLLIGRAYPQTATPTPSKGTSAKDPGVRTGAAGAGGAASSLTGSELLLFNTGKATFSEVDSVFGTLPGETDSGLGPSFNMNSCAGCHAFPATGGSSTPPRSSGVVDRDHGEDLGDR